MFRPLQGQGACQHTAILGNAGSEDLADGIGLVTSGSFLLIAHVFAFDNYQVAGILGDDCSIKRSYPDLTLSHCTFAVKTSTMVCTKRWLSERRLTDLLAGKRLAEVRITEHAAWSKCVLLSSSTWWPGRS